jgi:hypothetical protein
MKITVDRIRNVIEDPKNGHVWAEVIGDIIPANNSSGNSRIKLRCACGNIREVAANNVLTLHTKSCGCLAKKLQQEKAYSTDLDGNRTRLYTIWVNMRVRCADVTNPRYGGRGISVCSEWQDSFIPFRDWAVVNGYQENLTLDRKNNDGNYSPDNCRWATKSEQAKNTTSTRLITIGMVTLCLNDWCKELSVSPAVVRNRVRNGKSWEEAILDPTPVKKCDNNNLIFIQIGMVNLSLSNWCKELSIDPNNVKRRVSRGWSWEDAILKPSQRAKIKQVTTE